MNKLSKIKIIIKIVGILLQIKVHIYTCSKISTIINIVNFPRLREKQNKEKKFKWN